MGNWHISIEGVGVHHNGAEKNDNNASDAEKMAAEFVNLLKSKGHRLSHCSFTYGGAQSLGEPNMQATLGISGVQRYEHGLMVQTQFGELWLSQEDLARLVESKGAE